MIVIDSLTGYITSVGAAADIALQIRNLLSFLAQRNVTTLLISVQHGLLGSADEPTVAMSYLADTVVLLRYYEHMEAAQAVGVHRGTVSRWCGAFRATARPVSRKEGAGGALAISLC